jgi:hypothetical protein
MSRSARTGQLVLVVLGLLCAVIALSVFFVPDTFEDDALALISTYGVGMGLLVVALATAGLNAGSRWAWGALWVLPAFFVAHVGLLGTWLPDGVLVVVSATALLLTRPRAASPAAERVPTTSAA